MLLEAGEGTVPVEYVEYQIMKEMGWTYQDLMNTPALVVNSIMRYRNTEAKHSRVKA